MMTRKGVVKERLLQIISVTTQVAILSRSVSRFKLQLRDHQEKQEGAGEGGITVPHRWRGDGELGCGLRF